MKKAISYLSVLFVILLSNDLSAQSFNFSVTGVCFNTVPPINNTVTAYIVFPYPGATSYSWACSPGGTISALSNTNNVAISFSACGVYTVYCYPYQFGSPIVGAVVSQTTMAQCPNTAWLTANAPSGQACTGGLTFLTASGAASYTWTNGFPPLGVPIVISNSANAIVTPTNAFTMYTVNATSQAGCISQATVGVSLGSSPAPVVSVVASSTAPVCVGNSLMMNAIGALSYTWVPGNINTPNITVSPASNSCYTVYGSNSFGCIGSASNCVTVVPLPTVVASASSSNVCLGSSAVLTASGATSYIWSTNATTSSISVIPTASTCYSVVGSVNGCTAMAVSCVSVNTLCSDVWPGDANSDGIVNSTDVFEIGLAFGNTGPLRVPGGNGYYSQYANNWVGLISTGKNKCHADCNGDGTINNGDTLAIYNNFSLPHPFRMSSTASVGDINLVATQPAIAGQWAKADIMVGSAASPFNQVYGISYDVNFDKSLIQPDSLRLVYTASFFNASNNTINFRKPVYNNEVVHCANVRTNGTSVSGNGKIGEFWFKLNNAVPANAQLNLSISNPKKIGTSGAPSDLSGSTTVLNLATATGIDNQDNFKNYISMFPNPASSQLLLQSGNNQETKYSLFDITGRKVLSGSFKNQKSVDLSVLSEGAYFMRFESGSETTHKKLVIEK